MSQPNNIDDREFSKFVDSPTRINESAIETVSYVLDLPLSGSIQNYTITALSIALITIPNAKKIYLKSSSALRFRISYDSINWFTIPLGGWIILYGGAINLFIDNPNTKTMTIELLLFN